MSINFDQTSGWFAQAAQKGLAGATNLNLARETSELSDAVSQAVAGDRFIKGKSIVEHFGGAIELNPNENDTRTMVKRERKGRAVPVETEGTKSTPKEEKPDGIIVPKGKGVVV